MWRSWLPCLALSGMSEGTEEGEGGKEKSTEGGSKEMEAYIEGGREGKREKH